MSAPIENSVPTAPPQGLVRMELVDMLTRRVYFQGLGLVHLVAFTSLWTQIHGLVGQDGMLPANAYFKLAQEKLGAIAFWQLPSVCWFGASDLMLHVWCALGTALSVILIMGLAPRLTLILLWCIYLSLTVAGQVFLGFQWDALLLEMTACSVLYAPGGWRPDWKQAASPLPLARWLLWGLAFKLMFLSGVTKLLSGDSTWNDGTALQFHYYTQPIPNWISWYASQLPLISHQLALLAMFVVEVALPFLVFAGRRGRAVFGIATICLMVVIEATGNFGFFNLQTAVLCIPLLNDGLLRRWIPSRWFGPELPVPPSSNRPHWVRVMGNFVAAFILIASTLTTVREMVRTQQPDKLPKVVSVTLGAADRGLLSWSEPKVLGPIAPFRTINGYGLFRVMTIRRPEIVVETSQDGVTWSALEFPYKPGRLDRAPPIVAPHMPRLDWQMWFAGLNPRGNEYWLAALARAILEGNPKVARLLGHPQLARDPPRYVRLAMFEYKFSSPEQRRSTGAWWSRSQTGYLTGPLTRRTE